jgi:hypothetical protein
MCGAKLVKKNVMTNLSSRFSLRLKATLQVLKKKGHVVFKKKQPVFEKI